MTNTTEFDLVHILNSVQKDFLQALETYETQPTFEGAEEVRFWKKKLDQYTKLANDVVKGSSELSD
jgi:hypothetical protein